MTMPYFLVPIFVGIIIQSMKIVIDFWNERNIAVDSLWRAGGLPSVHSWVSSSIVTIMFLEFGHNSAEFAIAFTFAFLFWYDSMNIRHEAWKHAKYLNKINSQLKSVLEFSDKAIFFKERLWHTFIEVIWGIIVWFFLTLIIYFLVY